MIGERDAYEVDMEEILRVVDLWAAQSEELGRLYKWVDTAQAIARTQNADELKLAIHLIDQLTNKEFKPERYHDEYRNRVMELVNQKLEGKKIVRPPAAPQRGQVIDIMEALKQSLSAEAPAKKAARARRAESAAAPAKKARASRK